jgi:hypothetical protein
LLLARRQEVLSEHPYQDIVSWSKSPVMFSVEVPRATAGDVSIASDAGTDEVRFSFGTAQGEQISDTVQAYIDVLLRELKPDDDQ